MQVDGTALTAGTTLGAAFFTFIGGIIGNKSKVKIAQLNAVEEQARAGVLQSKLNQAQLEFVKEMSALDRAWASEERNRLQAIARDAVMDKAEMTRQTELAHKEYDQKLQALQFKYDEAGQSLKLLVNLQHEVDECKTDREKLRCALEELKATNDKFEKRFGALEESSGQTQISSDTKT